MWRSTSLAAASSGVLVALMVMSGVAVPGVAGAGPPARGGEVLRRLEPPHAERLPAGFDDRVVISGLTFPTVVTFSPDGRVFVGEQGGVIKVLYTLDAPIRGTPPVYDDQCADPLGDGCVAGARLVRLQASGDHAVGSEQVLLEGWCQQYPSHSIGTIAFAPDGALLVGGGEGASFTFADYGQGGTTENPCGDPGGPTPTPPTARAGRCGARTFGPRVTPRASPGPSFAWTPPRATPFPTTRCSAAPSPTTTG